jgi:hypothetical protein
MTDFRHGSNLEAEFRHGSNQSSLITDTAGDFAIDVDGNFALVYDGISGASASKVPVFVHIQTTVAACFVEDTELDLAIDTDGNFLAVQIAQPQINN